MRPTHVKTKKWFTFVPAMITLVACVGLAWPAAMSWKFSFMSNMSFFAATANESMVKNGEQFWLQIAVLIGLTVLLLAIGALFFFCLSVIFKEVGKWATK